MISFTQLRDRLLSKRPDIVEREVQLAYQIAVRRYADVTMALQEVHTFTVAAGARVASAYALVDEKEAVFILKAEREVTPGVFDPLHPLNARRLRESTFQIQVGSGTLYAYVSDSGKFIPYQPPTVDTQVRALIAYKPTGDFDEVDLPGSSEDAIVDGVLAELFSLPGRHRSIEMSALKEKAFKGACEDMRGVVLVGDTEFARFTDARPPSWGTGWGKLRW